MQRRTLLQAGLAPALLPLSSWAQGPVGGYPKAGSTLRYIVPFPPGGLTDVMARLVGQQLGERWKLNVVIDNKPGSGGQIGAAEASKAAGDGQTLLAITLAHAINHTLYPKASYNLLKDLRPVALLAGSPMVVVVPAGSRLQSLQDLVAAAKGGKLNAGSSGNGTPPHLTLALFNELAKTSIQHVPYKGGAPSMTDLIGGQLDVVFSNYPESMAHIKSGKLRALAVASSARIPSLPDVPTSAEAGMPGLAIESWTGMLVPASTPDAVVDALSAEAVKIMAAPEVGERARTLGFRVDARDAKAFQTFLANEVERWGRLIVSAKISAD
ncbi:tripartite tricarboxylate transporter substrate binding protein [Piscinibacter sakaiensis]|uniref:Putative exported protein n=1 Tax=Piscinibacter sakaiensis TaxID=1547922 RepID=A0A0K8P5I8_PISS1|nr:tripartite tricarboxylate transporter substrate binding protein [Piscinibacter sakaiensis]GAP37470.1 putative exported protein [Piscinibacter sakaiensis]